MAPDQKELVRCRYGEQIGTLAIWGGAEQTGSGLNKFAAVLKFKNRFPVVELVYLTIWTGTLGPPSLPPAKTRSSQRRVGQLRCGNGIPST
jgi:hypothetical protein